MMATASSAAVANGSLSSSSFQSFSPLDTGSTPKWTSLSQLPRWSERLELLDMPTLEDSSLPTSTEGGTAKLSKLPLKMTHQRPVFPVDQTLNGQICLWHGDILRLDVQVMAHPTNERFERTTALTNQLYDRAGAQLRRTLFTRIGGVRTGEVKLTKSYGGGSGRKTGNGVRPQYILHTASPIYKSRYRSAAESALFRCYESVLIGAKQCGLRTLALPPLAIRPFGYPAEEAAHLGLRVIRRFLERHSASFDLIVLATGNRRDYHLYSTLLPLYFPRDGAEESRQCTFLPVNVGGPTRGEPVQPERAIRIKESPFATSGSVNGGKKSFSFHSSEEWSSSSSSLSASSSSSSSYNSSEEEESFSDGTGNLSGAGRTLSLSRKALGKFARMHEECRDDKFRSSVKKQQEGKKRGQGSSSKTNDLSYFSHESSSSSSGRSRSKSMLSVGRALVDCEDHLSAVSSLNPGHHHHQNDHPKHQSCHHHRDAQLALEYERQLRRERLHRRVHLLQQENPAEVNSRLEQLRSAIYLEAERDRQGRKVLTLVGNRFTAETMADEVTLSYVLGLLDEAASGPSGTSGVPESGSDSSSSSYVIVYYHDSVVTEANVPKSEFLGQLTSLLSYRVRKSLREVYIVHPTVLSRLYFWWLKTFHFPLLKEKVTFVRRLSQLQVNTHTL